MTLLISLLHNSLHLLSIDRPYFGTQTVSESSVTLTPEHALQFDVDVWATYVKKLFEKTHQLPKGKPAVNVILGQRFFTFIRIDIPVETPPGDVDEYIRHHLFESNSSMSQEDIYSYELVTNRGTMHANVYILSDKTKKELQTLLDLFDMRIERIYPEAPLLFSAFSHTLNKNKQEPVFFLEHGQHQSVGLLFDAQGMLDGRVRVLDSHAIVSELKKIVAHDPKPARLIVSGKLSTEIRQDSFTKEVGMWTNPLHRILQGSSIEKKGEALNLRGEFALTYLREIILLQALEEKKELLSLSVPLQTATASKAPKGNSSSRKWITMTFVILMTAALTIGIVWGVEKTNITLQLPSVSLNKLFPAPTPTPSPTPKPRPTPKPSALKRESISISILNGVGTSGLAGTYQERMEGKGYTVTDTDNADNYDYKVTVIQTGNKAIYDLLAADLKLYVSGKPEFKKTDSTDSAVIILGADSE